MKQDTLIHQHFGTISDPRLDRQKRHNLINVIFIALLAVLCGAEDRVSIERFGKVKQAWLEKFLDLPNGIPSHDTFCRLLDSKHFGSCFIALTKSLASKAKNHLSIDGKTMRGTKGKDGLGALHIVSVFCSANKLVLAQGKVDEKSNEITAIPLLLDMLDIEGSTITIDAMGCQKSIAQIIIDKKADYVLALKLDF